MNKGSNYGALNIVHPRMLKPPVMAVNTVLKSTVIRVLILESRP